MVVVIAGDRSESVPDAPGSPLRWANVGLLTEPTDRVPQVSRGSRPGTVVVITSVVCAQSPHDATSTLSCSHALGLERWHGGHDLHFITFSCYDRQPLLATAQRRDLFLEVLERVRRRYSWVVLANVVMPSTFICW